MSLHITQYRDGFPAGRTRIIRHEDDAEQMPISLDVLKLNAGESLSLTTDNETAWLLMDGKVSGKVSSHAGNQSFEFERHSLFDESSSCVHVSAGTQVEINALQDSEFTVYYCNNSRSFAARVFQPDDVSNEPRGKGQVGDRCLRYVRTIFDGTNSPPEAELVLGEVITFQGGWSSYPPHHHAQPEIYHYRFTEPQGYGHGELGETVLKVRHNDTVKIMDRVDHAQCAAPGYGMYYSWVIRHLPDLPYTVPEFTEEHKWIMQPGAKYWSPES
ncbi:MAG TPA: 5-deoxy-glucuronate isomerase [Xanthomonadales bacterium]|nr:5-deoxy-glucuronate isomerase [Xanthomonadales bacterium]